MSSDQIIWVFLALFTKHFICDFLLQYPYHYVNKGRYGHFGGISHALIHVAGTIIALWYFATPYQILYLCIIDGVIHYHIDWAKLNINDHFGWKMDNSEHYWSMLGLDQYLHSLTYVIMIGLLQHEYR